MAAIYSTPGPANLEAFGITKTATEINNSNAPTVTAERAVVSDALGALVASDVTSAEIAHLDGVTSAIQTQLNGKMATWVAVPASATAAGTAGQLAYESGFLYVCVATDTWEKVAIATWA